MSTPGTPVPVNHRSSLILMGGIVVLVLVSLLASSRKSQPANREVRILCSFLPVYVFALNVVGDTPGVQVELLLSPDLGCPHDYSVRSADLKRVSQADVIVANGLGAEPFLDLLISKKAPGRVLTISDDTQPIASCGESHESEAEDHAGHNHDHGHDHGPDNPHVWASPAQAARQVRTLGRKLAEADPARAERYRTHAEFYARRLESLAERMRESAKTLEKRNIVTFHDAFAYLARDLDLNVVATLTVDPQNGPSARQMGELTEAVRKGDVAAIFYEPAYSDRLARTLARDTGVPCYPLNPFNYAEGKPDGASYERVMEENLKTLQQALGGRR